MAKVKVKKKTKKVGMWNKANIGKLADVIASKGDKLGNEFIEQLNLRPVDYMSLGIATIALAKGWAMVRDLGERANINVEKLYEMMLVGYDAQFKEIMEG